MIPLDAPCTNDGTVMAQNRKQLQRTDEPQKTTALNGEVVFAVSGKTGYPALGGGRLIWDARQDSREEFRSLLPLLLCPVRSGWCESLFSAHLEACRGVSLKALPT